jgi:hypothetical protein
VGGSECDMVDSMMLPLGARCRGIVTVTALVGADADKRGAVSVVGTSCACNAFVFVLMMGRGVAGSSQELQRSRRQLGAPGAIYRPGAQEAPRHDYCGRVWRLWKSCNCSESDWGCACGRS